MFSYRSLTQRGIRRTSVWILALWWALHGAACGQSQRSSGHAPTRLPPRVLTYPQTLSYDTSLIALIPFSPGMTDAFDDRYQPATLTQPDLELIARLVPQVVVEYNQKLEAMYAYRKIDLESQRYRRQIIAVVRGDGTAKEAWINCFCTPHPHGDWHKNVVVVNDGGSCYFNFRINLTAGQAYAFRVNGEA